MPWNGIWFDSKYSIMDIDIRLYKVTLKLKGILCVKRP